MNNNLQQSILRRFSVLGFIACLAITTAQAQETVPLEPGYTNYDKHLAVNTCMEYIYLQQYATEPANSDFFPLCEQRFLELSRRLSHEQFIKQRQAQITPENDYYQILFGIPSRESHGMTNSAMPPGNVAPTSPVAK